MRQMADTDSQAWWSGRMTFTHCPPCVRTLYRTRAATLAVVLLSAAAVQQAAADRSENNAKYEGERDSDGVLLLMLLAFRCSKCSRIVCTCMFVCVYIHSHSCTFPCACIHSFLHQYACIYGCTGKPHGKGVLTRPDGTTYDGQFNHGLRHGGFRKQIHT